MRQTGDGGIERPITLAHGLEDSQGGHADHADAVRGPEVGPRRRSRAGRLSRPFGRARRPLTCQVECRSPQYAGAGTSLLLAGGLLDAIRSL